MPDSATADLIGFAAVLAGELPGSWTSHYRSHDGTAPDISDVLDQTWDLDDVAATVATGSVHACAVLTHDDGTRLLVIDSLGRGETYLIAAVAPQDVPAEAFRGVREPDGITVPADPFAAAEHVTHDLLPRYDKALVQVRHNATRLTTAPTVPGDRVVMTWSGDALVVTKPQRADINQALTDHGFLLDANQGVYVLAGDDTARQAASVRAAGQQLSELGIDVVLRHPQARPALEATAAAPALPAPATAGRRR